MQSDPFKVLSVDKNTSIRDIKKQYLKLVKKLHPDKFRNQGQQAFENAQNQMALITKAYQILTDPTERAKYDNSQSSSSKNFQDMRNNFKRFDRNNQNPSVPVKPSFGESDLKDFNANFEQNRRRDPNDRGYGDELGMAPRMTTSQATRGYQSTDIPVQAQTQIQGSNFDPKRFNQMFEETVSSGGSSNEIIEKPMNGNPSGFSLMGSTAFSEVSVFDGNMIVGSEVNDFSSFDTSGGVAYTDYKKGYSETSIIKEGGQYEDDGMSLEQKIQMRDAGLSSGDMNQSSNMNKAEWQRQVDRKFEMEKQEALRRERENQRKIVMKYHDQYQDYLPSPESAVQGNYDSQTRQPPLNPIPVIQQRPASSSSQQSYQIPQNSRNHEINGKPVNPGFMRFMDDTQQYIAPSPVSPQQQTYRQPQYSSQQFVSQQPQHNQQPQHQSQQLQKPQQQFTRHQQYAQNPQQQYSQNPQQQYAQQPPQQYAPQQPLQQYSQQQQPDQKQQYQYPQQSSDKNDRRPGRSYNEFMMDRMHNMK